MLKKILVIDFLNKIVENVSLFRESKLFNLIKKYVSLLLIPIFLIYIFFALSRSEVNIFNYQTIWFSFLFLFFSFLISPIFVVSKSLIFNLLKLLLGLNSSFKSSLDSVLFASSLDVFTPAKINDFARLKGEKNKKIVLYAIFIERLLDVLNLSFFAFFNQYIYFLVIVFFALCLVSNFFFLYKKFYKSLFNSLRLINGSILISISHWLIAFKLFKTSFEVVLNSLNISIKSNILESITINKFSLVTILGVLPISVGGIGIREAAAIKIFDRVDPSIVFTSTIVYGLAVSGSISLLGIAYINLKNGNVFKV